MIFLKSFLQANIVYAIILELVSWKLNYPLLEYIYIYIIYKQCTFSNCDFKQNKYNFFAYFKLTKDTHTSPSQVSYGASFVIPLEKSDHEISIVHFIEIMIVLFSVSERTLQASITKAG